MALKRIYIGIVLALATCQVGVRGQDTWITVIDPGDDHNSSVNSMLVMPHTYTIVGGTSSSEGDFRRMGVVGEDVFVGSYSNDGRRLWLKTYGGSSHEAATCIIGDLFNVPDVNAHSFGSVITGWTSSNDGDFKGLSKGNQDAFVLKLDSNGNVLWKVTIGGANGDVSNHIALVRDGYLITGHTGSNDRDFKRKTDGSNAIFVVKLDPNGNVKWKKYLEGMYYTATAKAALEVHDGNIAIFGHTYLSDNSKNLFRGLNKSMYDNQDAFVVMMDKGGNIIWKNVYGGSGTDEAVAAVRNGGVLYVTGHTDSKDGDFKGRNNGGEDVFVIAIDLKSGSTLWSKVFGGSNSDKPSTIESHANNLYIGGVAEVSYSGDFGLLEKEKSQRDQSWGQSSNAFLLALDMANGNVIWKRIFGGSQHTNCTALGVQDGIVMCGTKGAPDGDFEGIGSYNDMYIMRLDEKGRMGR